MAFGNTPRESTARIDAGMCDMLLEDIKLELNSKQILAGDAFLKAFDVSWQSFSGSLENKGQLPYKEQYKSTIRAKLIGEGYLKGEGTRTTFSTSVRIGAKRHEFRVFKILGKDFF